MNKTRNKKDKISDEERAEIEKLIGDDEPKERHKTVKKPKEDKKKQTKQKSEKPTRDKHRNDRKP